LLVKQSDLPDSVKADLLGYFEQQQAAAQPPPAPGAPGQAPGRTVVAQPTLSAKLPKESIVIPAGQ